MDTATQAAGDSPALAPPLAGDMSGAQSAPIAPVDTSAQAAPVAAQIDPSPAPTPAPVAQPAAVLDPAALAAAVAEAVASRLALAALPAAASAAASPLQAASLDVLQIGEAVLMHQPLPRQQARALVLMALAALVPTLAHAFGSTPTALLPYLNDAGLGLAFLGAAIGDFTGLRQPKAPKLKGAA